MEHVQMKAGVLPAQVERQEHDHDSTARKSLWAQGARSCVNLCICDSFTLNP